MISSVRSGNMNFGLDTKVDEIVKNQNFKGINMGTYTKHTSSFYVKMTVSRMEHTKTPVRLVNLSILRNEIAPVKSNNLNGIVSMAQDVSKKMAEEPWILNEDGYLNADTDIKEIVYHPTLNVILLITKSGVVKVLDVNTGVVLQSSNLSGKLQRFQTYMGSINNLYWVILEINSKIYILAINQNEVTCRYIPGQDRILFMDGQAIGVRSEYNGVLLLDSILQKIVTDPDEEVRVELPLSEVSWGQIC